MHVPYSDVINKIADGRMGREFDSMSDAVRAVSNDETMLSSFAIVELIKRLDAIGKACGGHKTYYQDRSIRITGREKPFPSKNIGDRLYIGDFDEGFCECIVIAKNEKHHCMVVLASGFDLEYPPQVVLADENYRVTMADAVHFAAEKDTRYHGSRHEIAKAALAAAIDGEDLSPFVKGYCELEE